LRCYEHEAPSISGFRIDPDASLSACSTPMAVPVTAMAVSYRHGAGGDSSFLYTVNTAIGTISAFQ